MSERKCETCEWWDQRHRGDCHKDDEDLVVEDAPTPPKGEWEPLIVGYCRRLPPTFDVSRAWAYSQKHIGPGTVESVGGDCIGTRWPTTYLDDWCGEWSPRPPPPPQTPPG